MREIILDTETTGLDYKRGDRIIELACVELVNHIATGNNLQFYCSTDKKIDDRAQKVHGLTNAFLSKFKTFKEQANKFLNFIKDDVLIIHNAEFDLNFINNELIESGLNGLNNQTIDTVLLARKKLDTRMASLDYLCKRFSIDLSERKHHGALLDCHLLSEVYIQLLGGRQIALGLTNNTLTNKGLRQKNQETKNKIHIIPVSEKETKEHKDFVADLNNALWHKVNY
jgi:DNA polymerase-3 subunit epsilon